MEQVGTLYVYHFDVYSFERWFRGKKDLTVGPVGDECTVRCSCLQSDQLSDLCLQETISSNCTPKSLGICTVSFGSNSSS